MDAIEVLRKASAAVYGRVKGMAGTEQAAGDFGRGAGGDISRRIDIVAEKAVLECLADANFGCTVLGEECGRVEIPGENMGFVIMDAIDGSANAVRGVPFFCCSLAFAPQERLSAVTDAVVTDLANARQYWACADKGAYCNDRRISVGDANPIYKIVGVNTSGSTPELLAKLQPVFQRHNHTRHFGANALEMSMVASGLMDILIDLRGKIRVQDVAAGCLIVREAGGLVLDDAMQPLDSGLEYGTKLSFVAANSMKIIEELLKQ